MNRWLHIAATVLVALTLDFLGAWLVGLVFDGNLAFGLGLFWGVVVGIAVVGYWEEVIDARAGLRRQHTASLHHSRFGSESKS